MHSGEIDWCATTEKDEQQKLYNKYLLELTTKDMRYDKFCKAVVQAAQETATAIENKCEGWCTASKDILTPAIEEKNRLHHQLHDKHLLTLAEIEQLKKKLKEINKCNRDLVELAKACWYGRICGKIHNMQMNPRLAWENIRILTGGETAHHKTTINMAMKMVLLHQTLKKICLCSVCTSTKCLTTTGQLTQQSLTSSSKNYVSMPSTCRSHSEKSKQP